MTTKTEFKNHVDKCKKVVQKFGYTKKFECAGFILPDGKMINLCKRGGRKRYYEHFFVATAFYKGSSFPVSWENTEKYMRDCGAVRIRKEPIQGDVVLFTQSFKKPTEKQAQKMVKAVEGAVRFRGIKESEHIHEECEYEVNNPRPLDIQRWISKCWR